MADRSASNKPYPFTPAEFERLYLFKQAVAAGLYSEDLPAETDEASPATDSTPSAPRPAS